MRLRVNSGVWFGGWALLALSSGACWAGTAPVVSDTVKGLFTHRGVYDLKLVSHKDGTDVSNVEGKLVYEFSGSYCEGYSTIFRFVTRVLTPDGHARLTDMRTTSHEDGAGVSFDFVNQTYNASQQDPGSAPLLTEDTRGSAERGSDGIAVSMEKPKPAKLSVETAAMFPTQHLARLIEAAEAGDHVVEIKLYDGTEGGDRVTLTTSVIGKELPLDESVGDETAAAVPELAKIRRWPVSISYYGDAKADGKGETTPDYTLSYVLYANGVSRHMKIDYGDYVLEGKLVDFKPMSQKSCE